MRRILPFLLSLALCGVVRAEEPSFAGAWEAAVKNEHGTWKVRWFVLPDGRYETIFAGTPFLPDEWGKLAAAGGKWGVVAASRRVDGGTYEFKDPDTVTMNGQAGELTWKRADFDAAAKLFPRPIDTEHARVVDLLYRARMLAATWDQDAILVRAVINPVEPDGTVSLWNRSVVTCTFLSPSKATAFLVVTHRPDDPGPWISGVPFGSVGPDYLPVPRTTIDLVEAVALLRKTGCQERITRAELLGFAAAGKPNRCGWYLALNGDQGSAAYDALHGEPFRLTDYVQDDTADLQVTLDRLAKAIAKWQKEAKRAQDRGVKVSASQMAYLEPPPFQRENESDAVFSSREAEWYAELFAAEQKDMQERQLQYLEAAEGKEGR